MSCAQGLRSARAAAPPEQAGSDVPQDGWRMLPLKVKTLLVRSSRGVRSRGGEELCCAEWCRPRAQAGKGLEKYGFHNWFCVTLFKEHRVHEYDEQ